jgi:hypothetical protein
MVLMGFLTGCLLILLWRSPMAWRLRRWVRGYRIYGEHRLPQRPPYWRRLLARLFRCRKTWPMHMSGQGKLYVAGNELGVVQNATLTVRCTRRLFHRGTCSGPALRAYCTGNGQQDAMGREGQDIYVESEEDK